MSEELPDDIFPAHLQAELDQMGGEPEVHLPQGEGAPTEPQPREPNGQFAPNQQSEPAPTEVPDDGATSPEMDEWFANNGEVVEGEPVASQPEEGSTPFSETPTNVSDNSVSADSDVLEELERYKQRWNSQQGIVSSLNQKLEDSHSTIDKLSSQVAELSEQFNASKDEADYQAALEDVAFTAEEKEQIAGLEPMLVKLNKQQNLPLQRKLEKQERENAALREQLSKQVSDDSPSDTGDLEFEVRMQTEIENYQAVRDDVDFSKFMNEAVPGAGGRTYGQFAEDARLKRNLSGVQEIFNLYANRAQGKPTVDNPRPTERTMPSKIGAEKLPVQPNRRSYTRHTLDVKMGELLMESIKNPSAASDKAYNDFEKQYAALEAAGQVRD